MNSIKCHTTQIGTSTIRCDEDDSKFEYKSNEFLDPTTIYFIPTNIDLEDKNTWKRFGVIKNVRMPK